MDNEQRTIIVGISWYRRDEYARLIEIMEDGHLLPRSYDRWEELAEQGERQQIALGRRVHRAYIDPEQFVAWCAVCGHKVDAKARIRWANEAAFRHAGSQN